MLGHTAVNKVCPTSGCNMYIPPSPPQILSVGVAESAESVESAESSYSPLRILMYV